LPAWAQLTAPAWTPPPPSARTGFALDSRRDRLLILDRPSAYTDTTQVWALDLSGTPRWSLVSPAAPDMGQLLPRSAAYDSRRDRLCVDGNADPWFLDLATGAWSAGWNAGSRPFFDAPAAFYDARRDRMLEAGASGGAAEVWALPLVPGATWARLGDALPRPSVDGAGPAVLDLANDRVVMLAGIGGPGGLDSLQVWALSLADPPQWSVLSRVPPRAGTVSGASLVLDPVRDRLVLHGGQASTRDTAFADTWALPLAGGGSWVQLAPAGALPAPRAFDAAVYDAPHDRMAVFGGLLGRIAPAPLGDTWLLDFAAPAAPEVACPGDSEWFAGDTLALDYEVANGFGSRQPFVLALADARHWPGLPPADTVWIGAGERDTVRLRIAVPDTATRGANALALVVRWLDQPLVGDTCVHAIHAAAPAAELLAAAAEPGHVHVAWRSALGPGLPATLSRAEPPGAWQALADLTGDAQGGYAFDDPGVPPGTLAQYRLAITFAGVQRLTDVASVQVPAGYALALAGLEPNPAPGAPAVAFTLAATAPGRVELLDVSGRRLWSRDLAGLPPGRYTLPVGGRLRAGLYVIRLRQGGRELTRKGVVMP
ncbi:MAG TPA: hypothetical protein VGU27_12720, partial [Candidatus Eisenbacteria bacterium]|nr:hypothetical protein [Candidatus Eisenbacteria bacterium]